jgi:hypothetical protein
MHDFSNRFLPCCFILVLLYPLLLSGCGGSPSTATGVNAEAEKVNQLPAQQAVAGVGKEGQRFKDDTGVAQMMTGPLSALANVKQKVVLEIQVKQAIDVFKALEGRLPKSHEEFLEKCITANRIQLPELPEGHVYRFNTEKGELWFYPEEEAPPVN